MSADPQETPHPISLHVKKCLLHVLVQTIKHDIEEPGEQM